MAKNQRIPVAAIQAMKKTLDALPDKNIDKTKEEALAMLQSQIQRAYDKGYSVKELTAIMVSGNVPVSAPTLRTHTCPSTPRAKKEKPEAAAPQSKATAPKNETVKPEIQQPIPARQADDEKEPPYFVPDVPDEEL